MKLRRALLVLLGLWAGVGVVLAPARPMPGMAMGAAPLSTQKGTSATRLEHTGHGDTGHGDTQPKVGGHPKTAPAKTTSPSRPTTEPEPAGHDHLARCVLCVVGAGLLTLIIVVIWASSPARTPITTLRPFIQPTRFRHFQSRAPPAAFSS